MNSFEKICGPVVTGVDGFPAGCPFKPGVGCLYNREAKNKAPTCGAGIGPIQAEALAVDALSAARKRAVVVVVSSNMPTVRPEE